MTEKKMIIARRFRNHKKAFLVLISILFITAAILAIRWATYARPPLSDAVSALESSDQVQVKMDPWLTFQPAKSEPKTGLIFYPGGRIDPQGYAPLMSVLAAEGYLVIIPQMPFNMAPFNINVAEKIQAYYPQIEYWAIGGHSVGGTMAAQFTNKHTHDIDGLIFWASYPANNVKLNELRIPVTLIFGSLDPRVNAGSVVERENLLPLHTQYIQIKGGDHHQFGAYKITPQEHFAEISSAEQYHQIIQATLALLSEVEK